MFNLDKFNVFNNNICAASLEKLLSTHPDKDNDVYFIAQYTNNEHTSIAIYYTYKRNETHKKEISLDSSKTPNEAILAALLSIDVFKEIVKDETSDDARMKKLIAENQALIDTDNIARTVISGASSLSGSPMSFNSTPLSCNSTFFNTQSTGQLTPASKNDPIQPEDQYQDSLSATSTDTDQAEMGSHQEATSFGL